MLDVACVREQAVERGFTELAEAAVDYGRYASIIYQYNEYGRPDAPR